MIGIVIVSHSIKIAEGIQDLIAQMVSDTLPLATAAGPNLPDEEIGTDPMRVLQAIEAVYSAEGVVVLMDIGSALMSAETALEFLPPDKRPQVVLCEAPIIEGGLAAAVTAAAGGSLERVVASARNALAAKREQMASYLTNTAEEAVSTETLSDQSEEFRAIVPNRLGLHMRPAAKLVSLVQQYAVTVIVSVHGKQANATNINQLVTLGAMQGDELVFSLRGEETAVVRQKITQLLQDNFAEGQEQTKTAPPKKQKKDKSVNRKKNALFGVGVAAGIACGGVKLHRRLGVHRPLSAFEDAATEWQRLQSAMQVTAQELHQAEQASQSWLGTADTFIFTAQRLMLKDVDLLNQAQRLIHDKHVKAETAWREAIRTTAERYQALAEDHLRRRSQDVFDLGQRVLTHLNGVEHAPLAGTAAHILVAHELTPSEATHLDPELVLGLLLETGTATDHTVILVRALGIPTIVGVEGILGRLQEGQTIAFDGGSGQIWLAPTADEVADFLLKRHQWRREQARLANEATGQVTTPDGQPITLALNLNTIAEVSRVAKFKTHGIGLCRSENLFAQSPHPPTEDEQVAAYQAIAAQLGERPFVIRLFDFGGDKPAAFVPQLDEHNPALGLRGVRLLLDWPELLHTQLQAILRVSQQAAVKILIPMVSTLEEIQQVKIHLETVKSTLSARGVQFDEGIELGIMVETPSAVMMLHHLVDEVDFLSVGTNDLTQYMMAAERGNGRVAELNQMLQPAVIRALARIAMLGQAAGRPVTVCGEMAGHPLHLPLLIGLRFTSLSMNSVAIPQISALIGKLSLSQAIEAAEAVLQLPTAAEVESFLTELLLSLSNAS